MKTAVTSLSAAAAALREHHLRDLAVENLRILTELDAPLLKHFTHLGHEELLALTVQGLEAFLQDLESGRALETAAENLRRWEEGRMEELTTEQVAPSDMVLVAAAQKQAILSQIAHVAPDARAAMAIVRELEAFYTATQTDSFKAFTRLREEAAQRAVRLEAEKAAAVAHAEELQALNEELNAQAEELQHQTEELQSGQEELAALYEALQRRNEVVEAEVVERTRHLKEREAMLINAQALGNFGSWEWNPATGVLSWSEQLYRIYGLEPDGASLSFEHFMSCLHPDDQAGVQSAIGQALEEGVGFAFTERIFRPDGSMRILESTGEALLDDAGRVWLVRGVCQDVTERRQLDARLAAANEDLQSANEELTVQAEELQTTNEELHRQAEDLAEQRGFLAGIFDNLPGGIAILDCDLVYQSVNPTYAAMVSKMPETFIGRSVFEVFPGSEDQIGALLNGVLEGGEAYTAYGFPFAYEDETGRHESHWDLTYAPLREASGAVNGILVLCFEVTPRVQLEQAVAQQRALTERIVEHAPAGIAFLDGDLVYRRMNQAYAQLMGMSVDQVLDKSIYEVFPGATDQFEPLMRQVMATGVPYQTRDFSFKFMLNGEEKQTYWDFTYQPVTDQEGRTGILILEVEVSDRQEKERLQNEQIAQLRELDRYKDQFLSVISHELRTPLNFIMGFASTLEDEVQGPLNPGQHEAIGKILNGADRMLLLVDDLLDFAKIQSGRFELTHEPTAYGALVDEVVGLIKPLADHQRLALSVDVRVADALPMDSSRVAQVLTNLLNNAIKFTEAGGAVSVRAFVRDGALVTEVVDTGCGIAREHFPKLFKRFQQVDMSNTRQAGGTGLGLSIAKALVEAHGGTIGVESTFGEGSTFWFTLPLVAVQ